jgi:hypothetical protein
MRIIMLSTHKFFSTMKDNTGMDLRITRYNHAKKTASNNDTHKTPSFIIKRLGGSEQV